MATGPKHRLPDGRTPVLLSAHHEDLLGADAAALLRYLEREPHAGVEQIAAQLTVTRRIRKHRTVIRAIDRAELSDGLRAITDRAEHRLVSASAAGAGDRLAFIFPGQGSQWPGMGADAYGTLPGYRAVADMCAAEFTAAGARTPLRYLTAGRDDDAPFTEVEIEGAQFTHAVALAALWRSAGVVPDITVGHSLGEVAAAYVAGAITLAQAILVVSTRAGLADRLSGRHAVAALGISVDEARALIADTDGWVELSVVNAATSVAVSGDRDAVLSVVAAVRATSRLAKEITVGFPVHTSVLEPLRHDLRRRLCGHRFADTAGLFVGSAIGEVVPAGTGFDDYWYANLRDVVRFDRAVAAAARRGARAFVEMSAHPALLYATASVLAETGHPEPVVLVGSGRRGTSLPDTLSANMMTAAVADPGFRWGELMPDPVERLPDFPGAPMRAQHMWAHPAPLPAAPPPAVTVAAEAWTECPSPQGIVAGSVAVLGRGGAPLADALHAALQRCPGVAPAEHGRAQTLIVVAPAALDEPDPQTAVQALAQLVDDGLIGYLDAIGTDCRRVCLVSVRGEQIGADDALARPGQAALAAMHRSLGFEHPEVEFTQLDLPTGAVDPVTVIGSALAGTGTAALRADGDRMILWRRGFADSGAGWARTAVRPIDLHDVVITGGSGAIAGPYVRELAERGARRIVLLSRRGTHPQPLAALAARHGTELVSVRCDITDAEAVAAAAAEYGGVGATLLIHAAGAATFGPGGRLTSAALLENCAAKITGLAHLSAHWPLRADARILLCSSVSGVWGGRGHAGYAAANRVLDVMAAALRAGGRHCTALRWGLWQAPETGIVDAAEVANITRSGLRPMDSVAAIAAGFADHPGDPLVYAADARRLQLFLADTAPPGAPDALTVAAAQREAVPSGGADVAAVVRTELAAVLSITDAAGPDLDTPLFDLGIDSLLAIDLRKRLKRRFGRTVTLATLLGGATGRELVGELDRTESELARD